ncbi:metal-dependent hydrolase [Aquimixticola soesokkakensis]|uniref:UPF0173 metal-dependent hydrolase AQS8620_02598 n=1 Tax=Aquimixticola soesokkakensis TaxID=1519096 RepID=A0A1Y5T9D8_9RHOB|nr:metal-dependent hydrolase [Aquimixticola soesokkakensis]SLN58791.1 metal-dependent hydrolase [Aquimixticola soesokkakensis]
MKIIWLGHGAFRFEIGNEVLLVDPWITGNPSIRDDQVAQAITGTTAIFISHGHGDHTGDAARLSGELGVKVYTIVELANYWKSKGVDAQGFNKGGTITLDGVAVTMVSASHSSSMPTENGPIYGGTEAGFMIAGEGKTIYFSGDTDVMADMMVFEELHHPQIGILSAGGHFTMDMARATYAAKRFFNFETVIPCHYRTFPMLEQNADKMKEGLPGVQVIEPEVLQAIEL